VLDDFYGNLPSVGVSSLTGSGMDEFFKCVDASVDDYERNYLADLRRRQRERQQKEAAEVPGGDHVDQQFGGLSVQD